MIVQFKDLKVGDRFYLLGSEHIKISDKKYEGRLSRRLTNAICLTNNHHIVVGDRVRVDKRILDCEGGD